MPPLPACFIICSSVRAPACRPYVAQLADAMLGQFAGPGLVLHHGELIASVRRAIEAEHLNWG